MRFEQKPNQSHSAWLYGNCDTTDFTEFNANCRQPAKNWFPSHNSCRHSRSHCEEEFLRGAHHSRKAIRYKSHRNSTCWLQNTKNSEENRGSNLPEVTGSGCFSMTGEAAGFVHFPRFGAALALQMLLPELAASEVHGAPRKKSSTDELSLAEQADNDVKREHKDTDAIPHNSTAILWEESAQWRQPQTTWGLTQSTVTQDCPVGPFHRGAPERLMPTGNQVINSSLTSKPLFAMLALFVLPICRSRLDPWQS